MLIVTALTWFVDEALELFADERVHHECCVIRVDYSLTFSCMLLKHSKSLRLVKCDVHGPEEFLIRNEVFCVIWEVIFEVGMLAKHFFVQVLHLELGRIRIHEIVSIFVENILGSRQLTHFFLVAMSLRNLTEQYPNFGKYMLPALGTLTLLTEEAIEINPVPNLLPNVLEVDFH